MFFPLDECSRSFEIFEIPANSENFVASHAKYRDGSVPERPNQAAGEVPPLEPAEVPRELLLGVGATPP